MTRLIFFMFGHSLRSTFSEIQVSTTERILALFPTNQNELFHSLKEDSDQMLLFYFAEELSPGDKVNIRFLASTNRNLKIALCSHSSFALEAWSFPVFHFLKWPADIEAIIESYRKLRSFTTKEKELLIRNEEGVFKIPFSNILYFHAAGNYTLIQQMGDKNTVLTRQLGTFSNVLEEDTSFRRVHRSLILNFSHITQVRDCNIYFFNNTKPLIVSKSLGVKISKIFLNHG